MRRLEKMEEIEAYLYVVYLPFLAEKFIYFSDFQKR